MSFRRVGACVFAIAMMVVLAGATTGAAKKVKGKPATGPAGTITTATAGGAVPRTIDDDDGQGFYCTFVTPNVHYLGTLPANTGVSIDFESTDTSDPIAILTTLKMEGTDIGAETGASDDEGGNLNPRFELSRPYPATYILAVASADDDPACYAYRMRIR